MLIGCRNSLVNVEARAIEAQMYTRRCVITKLQDLAMDKYREIVSQNAGALLVLLPQNLTELPNIVKEVGLLVVSRVVCAISRTSPS